MYHALYTRKIRAKYAVAYFFLYFRSVPTLLVDLRKPLDKWDIENNSLRQEFNSEINSAYKSMLNFIDEIK